MSKKKLFVDQVTNELEGASLYFQPLAAQAPPEAPKPETPPEPKKSSQPKPPKLQTEKKYDSVSEQESKHASKLASTEASIEATNQYDLVETIRKTVKPVGKETSFVRLTPEEKHEISSIVFTFNQLYRGEGRKNFRERG